MVNIYRFNFFLQRVTAAPPKYLWIEPTNKCNFNCDICPVNSLMKRKKGFMEMGLFKRIVDNARKNGITGVTITNWGEPLLHPKIVDLVEYATKSEIKARIVTNGSLLTDNKSKELIQSGLDSIVFSIYGNENDYKKRTNIPFEDIKNKWSTFIDIKNKLNPNIKIIFRTVETDDNHPRLNKLIKEWSHLCYEYEVQQQTIFKAELIDNRKLSCPSLWICPVVLWDGRVVPCCVDYDGELVVGDMNKDDLKNLWNDALIKNLRKLHIKNRFPNRCLKCVERVPSRFVGITLRSILKKAVKKIFS